MGKLIFDCKLSMIIKLTITKDFQTVPLKILLYKFDRKVDLLSDKYVCVVQCEFATTYIKLEDVEKLKSYMILNNINYSETYLEEKSE